MGDIGDIYRASNEFVKESKKQRVAENFSLLQEVGTEWEWVDVACDHILIDGHIDYYLGKTYYFDRTTKKRGYAMLRKLIGDDAS